MILLFGLAMSALYPICIGIAVASSLGGEVPVWPEGAGRVQAPLSVLLSAGTPNASVVDAFAVNFSEPLFV